MEWGDDPPPHVSQCLAGSAMGRRNVEVKKNDETVELRVGVKSSKPGVSFELSSCFSDDDGEAFVYEDEDEDDDGYGPGTVYTKAGAYQKDNQRERDKGIAAAQTQMPHTKPKARALVACRQLSDGNEAASHRDQSTVYSLSPATSVTVKGIVGLGNPDCKRTFHATLTGKASVPAGGWDQAGRTSRRSSNHSRENSKSRYYQELSQQVEDKKQQREKERRKTAAEERKHNETMQYIWGQPGSNSPNVRPSTARRTKSLYCAGIVPQEQVRDKGFNGTLFRN